MVAVLAISCGGPTVKNVKDITVMGRTEVPKVDIKVIFDGDTVTIVGFKGQEIILTGSKEKGYTGVFEGFNVTGSMGKDGSSFAFTMDAGLIKLPVKLNY